MVHETKGTLNTFVDGEFIKAAGFAAFIDQDLSSLSGRPLTKRSGSESRVNRERCVKGARQRQHVGITEYTSDLRVVYACGTARMKVDTVVDLRDNITHQVMCHRRSERS